MYGARIVAENGFKAASYFIHFAVQLHDVISEDLSHYLVFDL